LAPLCRSAGGGFFESLAGKNFHRGIPKIQFTMSSNSTYTQETLQHKLLNRGVSALTDAEILSLIMGTGTTDLGCELLQSFGGLQDLARASAQDLMKVKGVGEAKAVKMVASFEIYRRKSAQKFSRQKLNSAEAVFQFLGPTLAYLDHEVFYVLHLNRNHELKSAKKLFVGGVNATVIDTRIVFRKAITELASSIILVHNHPSGNLKPSQPDRNITRKCQEAGKLFDIPVLDHVIISSRGYYSFANSGEM